MFMPHRIFTACFALALTCLALACLSLQAAAQTDEELATPTYVTARVFQARAPKSRNVDLSDQLFRLRTPANNDDEKWVAQLLKAYPDTEIALLQTQYLRVFKSPKPAIIFLGKRTAPHIEAQIFAAFGEGDGKKLGTTLIASVEYHRPGAPRPMSLVYQGTEVHEGQTYFFTHPSLNLKKADYVEYVRSGGNAQAFEGDDIYLIIALSVESDKPAPLAFDAKASVSLQQAATKKVEPQWPEELKKFGASGKVLVRVEVNAEGKVAQAGIFSSTLPEANAQALAAARQWEFSTSLLAGKPNPASAILTFDYAPAPPKAESAAPTKAPAGTSR